MNEIGVDNLIEFINGERARVFFEMDNDLVGYTLMSPSDIMQSIRECRLFIRLEHGGEPQGVFTCPIEELGLHNLQGIDKGAPGLAVCDSNGRAMFSLVHWTEENGFPEDEVGIYVCHLRDMLYR